MAARSSSKPHALAVPLPSQGHIQPLMELCKKLVSAGFMVTFANTEVNHRKMKGFSKIKEKKEESATAEEEGDLHLVSLEEGFPEYENALGVIEHVFKPEMKAAVARLLARLREKGVPVSLLAFDFRLAFLHDLALDAGIPSMSLWTQSAAGLACNVLVLQEGFQPPPDDSTLITCFEGVPPFKYSEVSGKAIEKIPPPFPANRYAWEAFDRIHEPTWIVLNTFKELEASTMDILHANLGIRTLALGPLVNAPSFSIIKGVQDIDAKHSHFEWLHGHPQDSVLYIAFGTIVSLSEEQLEELILGLEASQQPILWVFRPDLCRRSKKYTVDTLSRRFKNQGMVVDWASQWHILSHPAVGGFLTHCGWNSTLEGITLGVPMLAWPAFVDQFLTGRCLEEQWGIGLGFEVDESIGNLISRFEIQEKVKKLMQGENGLHIRERARSLSNVAKMALQEGGSSHQEFSFFMQSIEGFDLKV